jgi:hypothetical protein
LTSHHSEIETAIEEIDHIRKLLAKIKVRQIRNSEHRDVLKATAFSWFRNHRASIVGSISADLLAKIDQSYQTILNATEREAAKSTYLSAVNEAKDVLVRARSEVLLATNAPQTIDIAPDFTPLASDPLMQAILVRRWDECSRCLGANAPLAATVMMGGLLEALFVSRVNKLSDKRKLFASSVVPIDPKTQKPLDLRQWMLGSYIDVGHDLGWISRSGKDIAVILRDYRNYVHPEKERSHGIVLSLDDAVMFWEITKTLSRELLAMKGAV